MNASKYSFADFVKLQEEWRRKTIETTQLLAQKQPKKRAKKRKVIEVVNFDQQNQQMSDFCEVSATVSDLISSVCGDFRVYSNKKTSQLSTINPQDKINHLMEVIGKMRKQQSFLKKYEQLERKTLLNRINQLKNHQSSDPKEVRRLNSANVALNIELETCKASMQAQLENNSKMQQQNENLSQQLQTVQELWKEKYMNLAEELEEMQHQQPPPPVEFLYLYIM